jgi:hypothetical protein
MDRSVRLRRQCSPTTAPTNYDGYPGTSLLELSPVEEESSAGRE